jgi:hypothetical protein
MVSKLATLFGSLAALSLMMGGCPENFDAAVGATQEEIDRIVDDDDLRPEQKRTALESLGLSAQTINAILIDETLANQFGGDLRSAYNKVVAGQYRELTPDEVQFYGQAANDDSSIATDYTDTQAQSIVDFFAANRVDNAAELESVLSAPGNEALAPAGVPRAPFAGLFVDFVPADILDQLP